MDRQCNAGPHIVRVRQVDGCGAAAMAEEPMSPEVDEAVTAELAPLLAALRSSAA
jgi:hypothetical protein